MAGKKRTRKAAAGKGKGQSAKAKQEEEEEEPQSVLPHSALYVLLQELHRLALDPKACQKCMQALADGTAPVLTIGTASSGSASTDAAFKKKKRARDSNKDDKNKQQQEGEDDDEEPSPEDVANTGYWVLMATHMLNRLLPLMEEEYPEKVAQLMALVAYYTSRILLPNVDTDRAAQKLLEKACTNRARGLLGRAILSLTVATTASLEALVGEEEDEMAPLSLACWIPATLAMDSVARLSQACPKASMAAATVSSSSTAAVSVSASSISATSESTALHFWNHSQSELEQKALSIWQVFREDLESICKDLSQNMRKWEEPCLAALLGLVRAPTAASAAASSSEEATATASNNNKRARRKSSRSAAAAEEGPTEQNLGTASPLVAAFSALVDADDSGAIGATTTSAHSSSSSNNNTVKSPNAVLNSMKIDGRIAAKRWSSMAFVWILQGQKRVLEALASMLTKRQEWHGLIEDLEEEQKKKKKISKPCVIPPNVAFLAVASRLIGIVTETHANSGTRAPSGGLEAYVRAILPAMFKETAGGKKQLKKAPKAALPDLRNLVTVVLYHLVQAHQECLQENLEDKEDGLVNDEEDENLEDDEREEEEEEADDDEEEEIDEVEDMEDVVEEAEEGAEEEEEEGDAENEAAEKKKPNEEEEGETPTETIYYLPAMKQVVEGLCRATCNASSTASGSASVSTGSLADQALGVERLQRIAASFVLQSICQETEDNPRKQSRPLDVQLVQFAFSQFSECLEKTELSLGGSGEQQAKVHDDEAVRDHYHLLDPIPMPALTPAVPVVARRGSSRSKASSNESELCSFAGVFAASLSRASKEIREDDILSIFIRAVTGSPEADSKGKRTTKSKRKQTKRSAKAKDEEPPSSTKVYTHLLNILQRCYEQNPETPEEPEPKKRAAPTSTQASARKRRKTNEGEAEDVAPAVKEENEAPLRRPLNAHRVTLAKEINNVLAKCISSSHTKDSWALSLRKSLKDGLEREHVFQIVGLTQALEDHIIVPRTATFLDEKAKSTASQSEPDAAEDASMADAPNFSSFEKTLWLSHVSLCVAVGRGGEEAESTTEETRLLSERPLRDSKMRLAVFKNIASTFGKGSENQWPLWLPPGLRAMVAYEVTGPKKAPGAPEGDTTPERFVANGFIDSMSKALQDLQAYRGTGSLAADDRAVVDNNIPLSLHDARLFLVAVGRLNPTEQNKCLSKLVGAVRKQIKQIAEKESDVEIMCEDYEVSSLVARIITVCSYLMIMVAYPGLQQRLKDLVRHSQSPEMPGFISENDWYRPERCFMGIFSDWESARAPLIGTTGASNISIAMATDMAAILEQCFDIGFKAAKADRGQLLFAAWNAMGNRPLWDTQLRGDRSKIATVGDLLSDFQTSMQEDDEINVDLPKVLSHIREDVSRLCIDMQTHTGQANSLPLALKLLQSKDRASSTAAHIKKGLKAAVTTGERLVGLLLANRDTQPALFPTLEAAAVLITFGISSHTKPGSDLFSSKSGMARRKRPRGYSSESERDPSDFDSVDSDTDEDDPCSKLREKLRNACADLGAAPSHPDWLSDQCRLQYGFNSSEVVDSARTAVRALSRLLATCFAKYKESLQNAINAMCEQQEAKFDNARAVLARKIMVLLTRYNSLPSYPGSCLNSFTTIDYRQKRDFVSSLCDFDADVVDAFTFGRASENFEEAKTAWCPNSAQRIPGRFHETSSDHQDGWLSGTVDSSVSLPELRVNWQWEVLLGTTLVSSCRDVVQSADERESSDENDAVVHKAILDAENWLGVCETAVSCLMPASALLRFGLSRGGRKSHPLASEDESSPAVGGGIFRHFHINEKLAVSITASKQLRDLTSETVALLARFSGQCTGDGMPISLSCHAVASNLLINGRQFEHLRGFESLRFALTTLTEWKEANWAINASEGTDLSQPSRFLCESIASVIEFWGREEEKVSELTDTTEPAAKSFRRLMSLLCSSKCYKLDTIAENGVEASSMLALLDAKELDADTISSHESSWTWTSSHEEAIKTMISLLCNSGAPANLRTKACIAMMFGGLASDEYRKVVEEQPCKLSITSSLVKVFNSIEEKEMTALLSSITSPESDALFQREACSLLAYLVGTGANAFGSFSKVDVVVKFLLSTLAQWLDLKSKVRNSILDLLLLFGCRSNSLAEIGSALLQEDSTMETEGESDARNGKAAEKLEAIAKFFRFLQGLKAELHKEGKGKDPPAPMVISNPPSEMARVRPTDRLSSAQAKDDKNAIKPPPPSCSYALKSGFHGQHWYNCYTCGLTWDKGCCTLCALVCHEGCDVSYSRYSSFFCDCGAEDGGMDDPTRITCKCLSTIPKNRVQQLFEKEGWPIPKTGKPGGAKAESNDPSNEPGTEKFYIEMANESFPKFTTASMEALIVEANKSRWLEKLFTILRSRFDAWSSNSGETAAVEEALVEEYEPIECRRYEFLRQSLQRRSGKALSVEANKTKSIIPIRAAKSNTFQAKFSGSTNERLKRSKNEISRGAVVADSHGRLVIAEPCSLVFCSAAPAVNLRHLKDPADLPLSRSSICILGSSTLKFNVVGMRFCPENDRHLVVYGTSEACVALLSPSHDSAIRQITLCLDLDPSECETDYVVKCEWIPGSQTCVAIGCGRFVSIFDIARAGSDNRALPLISFGLGFDANLKDIAVTPTTFLSQSIPAGSKRVLGSRSDSVATLFVMLENGRLYSVDLEYDSDGKLSAHGDQQFETSESIALPMAGVRSYQGAPVGLAGSQSPSLGEGTSISYLAQSHLLLYKCSSSCVLALTLGISGKINGSFELLPHTLSPEVLGTGPNGYSIGGPYTHWTELGQTQDADGNTFFRVACVGRSWRTNQPKLLCVEFNDESVKVKEIVWDSDAIGLGLSLYSSFEGLCAFSLPFRVEDAPSPDSTDGSRFAERAFLCAVTSNGCLLLYGEENGFSLSSTSAEPSQESVTRANTRKVKNEVNNFVEDRSILNRHPITIFERLKNLSEDSSEDVVLGGDGLGSDSRELKRKLSRDNSVFLMSPRREGCTLTITLKPADASAPNGSPANGSKAVNTRNLALAAVRFQVGSTSSDCIPKKVFVQGRPIALQSGLKKWYSISLTDEEVALTVRSGVLAIGISQAHDGSSSPLIDALEVYAYDRREIEAWLPKILSVDGFNAADTSDDGRDDNAVTKGMVMASRSLESLCDLLGPSQSLPATESDLLKRMVQQTAVNRNRMVRECVDKLLSRLYPSPQARNSVKDEGALQGCSLLLSRCQVLLEATNAGAAGSDVLSSGFDNAWFTVRALLRSCLRTSSHIARCRPINYLRASDVIAENKISSGSIAVDSSKLISEGVSRGLPCEDLCELFVELSLAESAIADNTSMDQGENLAGFTLVRSLLESSNLSVVERSCHAISCFCRMYESSDQTRGDGTNDLFASLRAARVVCYQCDNCGAVPIKGVRYTLLEDDHDIDLCKDCFRLASEFAKSKNYNESDKVAINGKVLDLSCKLVKAMQPVPIVKADVTEVMDVDPAPAPATAPGGEAGPQFDESADDEELRRALRLSMGNAADDDTVQVSHKVDQSLEDFVDSIFSSVVDLLANALSRHDAEPRLGLMLGLLIDLVHHSSEQGGKLRRAKKLASEVAAGAARLVASKDASSKEFQRQGRPTLIMCLRALAYLLVPEIAGEASGKQGKESSDKSPKAESKQEVLCDVHGVPAARRRCARGEHKDRRFYVCGLERPLRCKFFVWFDELGQKQPSKPNKRVTSKYDRDLASALWKLFSSNSASAPQSLHLQLCGALEAILDGWKSGPGAHRGLSSEDGSGKDEFLKIDLYDRNKAQSDLCSGVFCSREKLHDFSADKLTQEAEDDTKPSVASIASSFYADGDVELIESSLELLALIANHETEGISRWFCILCEVISSPNKSSKICMLAKRVLKQLCGGKKDIYHAVRDHYVFGFQVKMLLQKTQNVLKTCLLLKEKARQSGPRWKSGAMVDWAKLKSGGLIGTELLVSEEYMSLQTDTTTGELLDDLSNVAKNRVENWRRFCGLSALPQSSKSNVIASDDGLLGEFHAPAPIIALLWMACGLQGPNQVKVLRLIDLALTNGKDQKSKTATKAESSEDEEMAGASPEPKPKIANWLRGDSKSPEEIILNSDLKCDAGDVFSFLMSFAFRGRTADVRKVSCSIVSKLMKKMKPGDVGSLLGELLGRPLCDSGLLGKNSVELLNVLHSQLRLGGTLPINVKESADLVLDHFKQQGQAIKHDRANGEWVCIESSSGAARKRFDLSNCVHCHWNCTAAAAKEATNKSAAGRQSTSRAVSSSRGSTQSSSADTSTSHTKREWLPEQVSGFSRGRLDSSKESTTNDAFCSYRQLKYRLALSEVHVNVNDPRGRFVKTLTVYFTPRPVEDVQVLKSDAYLGRWQKVATLTLTRGASRASATLAVPVVASNLKIEFTDFYERPGGSKAADGSFLVHCPRCTRVVNNAHGVCGNCGEVAFQCRKCRHINYDQLQSFLCVECGFCSAGSFSFDLMAGVCSNAIAITNDDDMERTVRMYNTATRLHEDLRDAVREKLRMAIQMRKPSKDQSENGSGSANQNPNSFLLSPGLRRAFQGHDQAGTASAATLGAEMLLNRSGKKGWAVKMIAMPNPLPTAGSLPLGAGAAATDRTRSLLRLARQLRTEGGSPDRRRSGEVIIRQLGRGGSGIEALDEENDLLSLLDNPGGPLSSISGLTGASGAGLLDSADPLSRLLASFQTTRSGATSSSRGRSATSSSRAQALSSSTGSSTRDRTTDTSGAASSTRGTTTTTSSSSRKQQQDSAKEALDESEKLHALMREAEREAYELRRRMEAWRRLERDELADKGDLVALGGAASDVTPFAGAFAPSHCSVCSSPVAVQLLMIWLRLFQYDPANVTVTQETIELMLEENIHLSKSLMDLKRLVLREIAVKAPAETSRLVLNELAKRLRYARDVTSAEILGKIIAEETDFPLIQDYVNLALEALKHETIF